MRKRRVALASRPILPVIAVQTSLCQPGLSHCVASCCIDSDILPNFVAIGERRRHGVPRWCAHARGLAKEWRAIEAARCRKSPFWVISP
ncbi:hypothetical protein B0H15DRAFT_835122 [Mycena belliarum]|uniref:Uncharacterized protein n=1 Tax=Mycena belliarum TaxID=1033014 RepID=A0AAD6UBI9_9AGAR|nr:hypothetical protein B0H15DRAFT_835122 [Mycena belliae]